MNSKEILKKLISYNTINDKDNEKIIDFIEQYLKKIGFRTEYKSKCLVMSNREKCDIGFLGHTDTVSYLNDWSYNPLELNEIDGKLYGLGTCDMKGAIATILSTVSKVDFNEKGIRLFFTYDEEISFSGINELVNNKIRFPKYMIIGEPTNNEIINASKGLLEFKIVFKGVPSHSSKPEEGVNAIDNCIDFINKLKVFYEVLRKDAVDSKRVTMNVGLINGGRSINIVADRCEVYIDFRTITKEQNERVIEKVKELLNGVESTIEIINNIRPFCNNDEKVNMSDFITEASFIESDNKYILGVGPVNAHKRDEFITISSLNKLEEQYIEIINERCK